MSSSSTPPCIEAVRVPASDSQQDPKPLEPSQNAEQDSLPKEDDSLLKEYPPPRPNEDSEPGRKRTGPTTMRPWKQCMFCGMNPPDHPGRHCPQKPPLKKCKYCGMDPPDHQGKDCPGKPRPKQRARPAEAVATRFLTVQDQCGHHHAGLPPNEELVPPHTGASSPNACASSSDEANGSWILVEDLQPGEES